MHQRAARGADATEAGALPCERGVCLTCQRLVLLVCSLGREMGGAVGGRLAVATLWWCRDTVGAVANPCMGGRGEMGRAGCALEQGEGKSVTKFTGERGGGNRFEGLSPVEPNMPWAGVLGGERCRSSQVGYHAHGGDQERDLEPFELIRPLLGSG